MATVPIDAPCGEPRLPAPPRPGSTWLERNEPSPLETNAETNTPPGEAPKNVGMSISSSRPLVAVSAPFLVPRGEVEQPKQLDLHVVRLIKVGPRTVRKYTRR